MEKQILELIFQFAGLIVVVGCGTGIIITYLKRRSKQPLPAPEIVARLDEIVDRLGRLENAIDSTAVEVERISEAQRFTARVLAERSATPGLSEKLRGSTTPH